MLRPPARPTTIDQIELSSIHYRRQNTLQDNWAEKKRAADGGRFRGWWDKEGFLEEVSLHGGIGQGTPGALEITGTLL